jgi:vitamin B12 transporter
MSRRREGLIAALSLVLAIGAGAQEPEPTQDPSITDEIVVLGVRPGALDPIPGASRDVLFTDEYTAENKSLADLLSESEGVFVRRFGAPGDRSEVTIRGSTPSQVVVAIDGVRANSALTGGFDLSRACLPLIEEVQITRGAGSSEVGSGAIGGVVDIVTRGPGDERSTRLSFTGGSFDTYEGSLLHADHVGLLDYQLGYCGFATEGDFDFVQPVEVGPDGVAVGFEPEQAKRLNNDRQQHGATLGLGYPLGPGELRLSDYFVHSEGGEPGFDGGNGPTAGQSTEAHSRDLANLAQLRWEANPSGVWGDELTLAAYHRFERTHFEDPVAVFSDPIDLTDRLQTLGARGEDTWILPLFGQSLETVLRADGTHDWLRASDQPGRDRNTAGASLDPTLRLWGRRLALSAGVRLDWAEDFGSEWLPRAGLVFEPVRWLRLRGQAGRAYRVPNFDELYHPDEGFVVGNPDLDPEDAWNYDVGVEIALERAGPFSDIELGAAVFRRDIDQSIVWLLVSPNTLRPENLGSATVDGLEVSGALRLTRFLRFSIQYSRTDSHRDATGEDLPGTPDQEAFGRLQLGPPQVWKLVGEGQYVGDILVNEGGTRTIRARTVWNASAALNLVAWPGLGLGRLASELWIYGRVDNIGDVAVRDSLAFPQPGRHASAGFEVRW